MNKEQYEFILRLEKAVSEKYGKEAIADPNDNWDKDKEKDYLEQVKILSSKERKVEESKDKVEHDGFLISKKLLNKESNRICPVCESYSMKIKDDVFMNKYECCFNCFIQWVEDREERWASGWRPTQKQAVLGEQK
tara:strand:- start:458 stop:865 length:408 start_codon:yes stop_codon:yes gene_type:complete